VRDGAISTSLAPTPGPPWIILSLLVDPRFLRPSTVFDNQFPKIGRTCCWKAHEGQFNIWRNRRMDIEWWENRFPKRSVAKLVTWLATYYHDL
jgi:hypothetical protein